MKTRIRNTITLSVSLALMLTPWASLPTDAGTTTTSTQPRPQIVIAMGNSQSMDGDLSGAIMTGSGSLVGAGLGLSGLQNSSSPVNYSVPLGFTPPVTATSAPTAPYTQPFTGPNGGSDFVDNGASRLNVAKAGIASVLNQYLPSMDFALEDYDIGGNQLPSTLYNTWVYYMSNPGGFTFTNTGPASTTSPSSTVINPCYGYNNSNPTTTLDYQCSQVDSSGLYNPYNSISTYKYMSVSASSDDADINDVLYDNSGQLSGLSIVYNASGNAPASPYSTFTLSQYHTPNTITVSYDSQINSGARTTGPTNAGYVPFSTQVMYAQRGFGFYQSAIPTDGYNIVRMTTLGANPTSSQISTALARFQTALAPETSSLNTHEIKALAVQSPLAGLVQGAATSFTSASSSCAGKYLILVTDGLPTQDLSNNLWPPLGSAAGAATPNGYGVNAAFYGVAGNAAYGINNDSGNTGGPVGTLDASNTNDQALIDTITAIQNLNSGSHPIKTYVIGLGAGVDSTANPAAYAALNAMAIAGGTGQEYPANNVSAFNAALSSIAGQIFSSIAVSAPVAPTSITGGSLIYTATSDNNPGAIAGHIQAYGTVALPSSSASAPVGTASGPAVWDAGAPSLMSAATRQTALFSTTGTASGSGLGSGTIDTLNNIGNNSSSPNYSPSAFALSATTCVPNISTILAYTFDPSFNTAGDSTPNISGLGFPTGVAGCSYLAGRQLNWMLGGLSPNDHVQYLGPPGNANLLGIGGYVPFARNNSGREKLVLFTSNDGFLYAVDATTGKLVWGWMPRSFLANLQYYTSFQTGQYFDGAFTTTDAADTSTSPQASDWASYVVGAAGGGAYHYALKLSSNGSSTTTSAQTPSAQTWGINVAGGSSPQEQAPIIASIGGMQYAVFVVNTTTGSGSSAVTKSTLYEVNVATGQPATGTALSSSLTTLPSGTYVNSSLTYVPTTGTLWLGDNKGGVWSLNISGSAPSDAGNATQVATTSPAAAINYVGYTEISGLPYIWAATTSEITTFALSGGSSNILWASSGTSGYQPDSSGTLTAVSSTTVMPLQSGGQISAAPVLVNGVLVVPVYVPPSGSTCGVGTGYYDLFDLLTGNKPKITITYKNNAVLNGVIALGAGIPLSPAVYVTPTGTVIYPGSSTPPNTTTPNSISPIQFGGNVMNKPIAWRQY